MYSPCAASSSTFRVAPSPRFVSFRKSRMFRPGFLRVYRCSTSQVSSRLPSSQTRISMSSRSGTLSSARTTSVS